MRWLPALALVVVEAGAASVGEAGGGWSDPEVIAQHIPGGRIGVALRGLIEPGGRTSVCWSQGRIGAWTITVAQREAPGVWRRAVLATIDQARDPEPQIARGAEGTLVVAWGGSEEHRGGGYSRLLPGAASWSQVRPVHETCDGPLALGVERGEVFAVYVRSVTQLDLRKPVRDFIHDPYVQARAPPRHWIPVFDAPAWAGRISRTLTR